jgi:hypothetical protein
MAVETVGGLVMNDMTPAYQNAASVIPAYQQAAQQQQELLQQQQKTQSGQIGLDELQATQPARLYEAYTGAVKGSNTLGSASNPIGADDMAPMNVPKVNELMNQKFDTPQKQAAFKALPPDQQNEILKDMASQASGGKQMSDLTPVGQTTSQVLQDKDGNLHQHTTKFDFNDLNAFKGQLGDRLNDLGPSESQAQVGMQEAGIKASNADFRAGIAAGAKLGVADTNAASREKINTDKINNPTRPVLPSDLRADLRTEASIQSLLRADAYGRVNPEAIKAAQDDMQMIKDPIVKQRVYNKIGVMTLNGPSTINPVGSVPNSNRTPTAPDIPSKFPEVGPMGATRYQNGHRYDWSQQTGRYEQAQ